MLWFHPHQMPTKRSSFVWWQEPRLLPHLPLPLRIWVSSRLEHEAEVGYQAQVLWYGKWKSEPARYRPGQLPAPPLGFHRNAPLTVLRDELCFGYRIWHPHPGAEGSPCGCGIQPHSAQWEQGMFIWKCARDRVPE